MSVPMNDFDDYKIGTSQVSKLFLNGTLVWPRGVVVGIEFVSADTRSGTVASGGEVFPSADGAVEFWREGGSEPRNWRATPKAGEARFSEYEFPNTSNGHADGSLSSSRGTLQEISGSPIIYHGRRPSGSTARVWRFDPVANAHAAITASTSLNQLYDVTVRDSSSYGWLIGVNASSVYVARRWTRSSEGTTNAISTWVVFSGGEAPESIDVEADEVVWAAGGDGSGGPYVVRIGELGDEITWTMPTISGYSWSYIDTVQNVGSGEAIGLADNDLSGGDEDFLSIFRFRVGESAAADITDGVTVDGTPYRSWAATNADNILVQSGLKMAVLGEKVAAITNDGTILLGTLVRS